MMNSAPQIPLANNIAELEALVAKLKKLQAVGDEYIEMDQQSEYLALIEMSRTTLKNTRRAILGKVMPALYQRLEREEQEAL